MILICLKLTMVKLLIIGNTCKSYQKIFKTIISLALCTNCSPKVYKPYFHNISKLVNGLFFLVNGQNSRVSVLK